eukprot:14342521-Heterocapsa_arctica.AAC.1
MAFQFWVTEVQNYIRLPKGSQIHFAMPNPHYTKPYPLAQTCVLCFASGRTAQPGEPWPKAPSTPLLVAVVALTGALANGACTQH